jgi:cell wall-associated NlpC family hydrolase
MTLPVVRITGPRPALDPRIHIARGDLVEIGLAGIVAAGRYTAPLPMIAARPHTPLSTEPDAAAPAVSELLHGEAFDVYDIQSDRMNNDWAFGRTLHDGYTGWLPLAALADPPEAPAPAHLITARSAPVFARPDIKAPILHHLPMGAQIHAVPSARFLALAGGGHVHKAHVAPHAALHQILAPLAIARLFADAPYVWGGRTPNGVDCSGLVQSALAACNIPCPRDSDQQRGSLGTRIDPADAQAGDIAFFPGHVGFLTAQGHIFHANAHWMRTMEEPLADVLARLGGTEHLLAVKRLDLMKP